MIGHSGQQPLTPFLSLRWFELATRASNRRNDDAGDRHNSRRAVGPCVLLKA